MLIQGVHKLFFFQISRLSRIFLCTFLPFSRRFSGIDICSKTISNIDKLNHIFLNKKYKQLHHQSTSEFEENPSWILEIPQNEPHISRFSTVSDKIFSCLQVQMCVVCAVCKKQNRLWALLVFMVQ